MFGEDTHSKQNACVFDSNAGIQEDITKAHVQIHVYRCVFGWQQNLKSKYCINPHHIQTVKKLVKISFHIGLISLQFKIQKKFKKYIAK